MYIVIGIIAPFILLWIWIERGHFLLPGTWPALKWMGPKRVLTQGFHAVLYGRWTASYVAVVRRLVTFWSQWNWGRYVLYRLFADRYHGKVLTETEARNIITLDRDIPLRDLGESIIPYSSARDMVLSADGDLALFQCSCKTSNPEPCKIMEKPYNSCILIGTVLVNYLTSHHPHISTRCTRDEALEKLEKFHSMGLVHCAWFKNVLKDQMYVICSCCSCCCLGFHSTRLGVKQIAPSGHLAIVDRNTCRGCGVCAASCPFQAIAVIDGKSAVDAVKCGGCGVCIGRCADGARRLERTAAGSKPLDITEFREGI